MGTTFAERLVMAIGTESVHAFSKRSGISDTSMRQYLRGTMPGLDKLLAIKSTSGVTLDWLATGEGPMRQDGAAATPSIQLETNSSVADFQIVGANGNVIALLELKPSEPESYSFISRLDVTASAGNGAVAYDENPLDFLAFQTDWLRARNIRPEHAKILTARGDSMTETIQDGDALLVDTSINQFKDNAIYVLMYGNMVLVKRIHARMNGSVQLISDNPRYPVEEVTAGEVDQITVAGRVMWFGRTM